MKVLVVLFAVVVVASAKPGLLGAGGILGDGILGAPRLVAGNGVLGVNGVLAAPGVLGTPRIIGARGILAAPGVVASPELTGTVALIPAGGPANIVLSRGGFTLDTPAVAPARGSPAGAIIQSGTREAVFNVDAANIAAGNIAFANMESSGALGLGVELGVNPVGVLGLGGLPLGSTAAHLRNKEW